MSDPKRPEFAKEAERQARLLRGRAEEKEALDFIEAAFDWPEFVRRGDLVIVSASRDYGRPRPAVIIQSDWLKATDSVLVALLTSALADAPLYRLQIEPTAANGLKAPSQVWSIKSPPCRARNAAR